MKTYYGGPLPVPLTPAVACGDILFISGQVPTRADGSIPDGVKEQTRIVLEKVKALVEQAGFAMADVVKTTVFLADMNDFAAMNTVYKEFFPENPPARSCVRAEAAIPIAVEIEAIAARDSG